MEVNKEFNEKHTPRIEREENRVIISFGPHPMEEAHYIHWVELYGDFGNGLRMIGRIEFSPHVKPFAVFELTNKPKKLVAIAYCNIHGVFESQR